MQVRVVKHVLGAALVVGVPSFAGAQNYPSKPIRLVVPFDAGGTVDALARVVTAQITKQSGVRFIVDNRPGANSAIGSAAVARATPDGYTVLNVSPSLVLNALLSKDVPYDLQKDFVPVTNIGVGQGYLLVARQELPVNSVNDLIALAKKRGDKRLTYGTPGIGNALHVASEIFATKAATPLLHVPYKGSAPALAAIAAGEVDLMMLSPPTVFPYVQSGRVRPIAFTGSERSKEFPNVPTMKEAGVEDCVIKGTWVGWFVPAGTPQKSIAVLAEEVRKAVQSPEVAKVLMTGGFEPDGRSPAEFARFVKAEGQRFGEVLRNAKIELK
ncbi:MAG: tripartite tricarboxylate transporter substrate binding protein [Proteobacteria bacterium]|nr:tripartite tricarboxylate transporter substrate binding protein [Pseudomonadota bacterium]